jgi:hypothetical protein
LRFSQRRQREGKEKGEEDQAAHELSIERVAEAEVSQGWPRTAVQFRWLRPRVSSRASGPSDAGGAATAGPAHRRTVELVHHARIPRPLKLILVSSRGCPPREEAGGMRWVAITVTASPAENVVHSPSDAALTSSFPKACGALSSLVAALIKSPSYRSSLVQAKCAESVCLVGAAAGAHEPSSARASTATVNLVMVIEDAPARALLKV